MHFKYTTSHIQCNYKVSPSAYKNSLLMMEGNIQSLYVFSTLVKINVNFLILPKFHNI